MILEFESVEQAKRWYHSAEYTAIKAIRHKTARTQLIVVSGIEKDQQGINLPRPDAPEPTGA